MSQHRHLLSSSFRPSAYSTGIQPRQPYSTSPPVNGQIGGYSYGGFLSLMPGYDAIKDTVLGEDKPSTFSIVLDYWWVFAIGIPVAYLGANYLYDKAGKK